jgi:hypothetical protein
MSEFTKAMIGFAIALLATLFTIHPIVVSSTAITFTLFSFPIKMAWFYYTAMGLFSASVYLYALAFMSERASTVAERAGNILYACALLVPPVYLLLFASSFVAQLITQLAPHISSGWSINVITSVLSAILTVFSSRMLSRILNRRDRQSQAEVLDRQEGLRMDRAASTFRAVTLTSP